MPDVSLHGRVAPKSKSINVEANLLAERLENRRRVHEFVRKRLLVLTIGIVLSAVLMPPAFRFNRATSVRYKAALQHQKDIDGKVDLIQKQLDAAQPAEQNEKAVVLLHECAHQFVGEVTLFLNKVNPRMSLSNFGVQVLGSQFKFTAQAGAIDYTTASDFVQDLAGKDPSSTLVSAMNSDPSIGKDGVNFNLTHTVQLQVAR